jgi:hypothetical protein
MVIMNYIKHIVVDMDESNIQNCVICGLEIANYNGIVFIGDPPKGWPAGEVFITNYGVGVTHFTNQLSEGETSTPCTASNSKLQTSAHEQNKN